MSIGFLKSQDELWLKTGFTEEEISGATQKHNLMKDPEYTKLLENYQLKIEKAKEKY